VSATPETRALWAAADKHAGIRKALQESTLAAFKVGFTAGIAIGLVIAGITGVIVALVVS
jgi:hypothetical protein